jgi:hypothetical protein
MAKWQLRDPYFHGPNTYTLGPDGDRIEVVVDKFGIFEMTEPPKFILSVFAGPVDQSKAENQRFLSSMTSSE